MEPVETFDIDGLLVSIYQDTDIGNPYEEYDEAGYIWIPHLFCNAIPPSGHAHDPYTEEGVRFSMRYLGVFEGAVCVPVQFQDYGSNGARVLALDDHEGANGLAWVFPPEIEKEWDGDREAARRCLVGQVETLDQWVSGEVFGYVIETERGEHLDSLWGMYGAAYCRNEAVAMAEYLAGKDAEAEEWAAQQGIPTIRREMV